MSEDFGPNGAKGRAVFNPAIAVSLVVTLYRVSQKAGQQTTAEHGELLPGREGGREGGPCFLGGGVC